MILPTFLIAVLDVALGFLLVIALIRIVDNARQVLAAKNMEIWGDDELEGYLDLRGNALRTILDFVFRTILALVIISILLYLNIPYFL